MRVRKLALAAVLVVVACGVVAYLCRPPSVSSKIGEEAYEHIEIGKKARQAEDVIGMPPGDYRDDAFREASAGWAPSASSLPVRFEGDDGGDYARVSAAPTSRDPVTPVVWCGNAYRIQVGVDEAGVITGKSLAVVPTGDHVFLAVRQWLDW